jgi:hypothetical protein
LTGVTSVVGTVRRWSDRAIVQSAAATVTGPTIGQVELPLTTMISSSPGLHAVEFRVTASDQRTYPSDPLRPEWLLLAAPLVAGASLTAPNPGAPVVVAVAGAGGPLNDGQLVFAGASSTVTMPAGWTWGQIAWSGSGSPWTSATVPTIVQAGATIDPSVPAALLASGGNLVVLTKVGTVITALSTGRATIWAYNGTTYGPDPDARLFEQGTGEPAPTGLLDNDITLQINP